MTNLCESEMIQSVFPLSKNEIPLQLRDYWDIKDRLYTVDRVILRDDNVVPKPLVEYEPDEYDAFYSGQELP